MVDRINTTTLDRWRRDPISFIETCLFDPETNAPFVLLEAEREFLKYAFRIGDDGRLIYPEQVYACPKKSGKSTLGALHMLTMVLLFGGRFAEGYALANDLDQAISRVFQMCRRITAASPLLRHEAKITEAKIAFPAFYDATICAIASGDAAGAAGGSPVITNGDELWGFTSERSRRVWDEMLPSPTRRISCRLVTTYAGFSNESVLLEELYRRGMQQPEIAPSLYGGGGLLMFWSHSPVASWQDAKWLEQMRRSLRPNQYLRMIENRWVTSESSFVDLARWDAIVDRRLGHAVNNRALPVWIGIDASTKHDATAVVAVTFDRTTQQVRLATHRTFHPSPDDPLDFELTVEAFLLDLSQRFNVRRALYDPYQMQSTAQRLARQGLHIEEFPQSLPNLTAIGQNLFDLIQGQNLVAYPDPQMRLAISRAVAVETPRGFRISKQTQSHKIDVVIALAMAAYAAVQDQSEGYFNPDVFDPNFVDLDIADRPAAGQDINAAWRRQRLRTYMASGGLIRNFPP